MTRYSHLITLTLALMLCAYPANVVKAAEIYGWGDTKLPNTQLAGITKIAAGLHHSLALKSDGSIVAWGNDEYGVSTPPAGKGYTAIASGGSFCLAIKAVYLPGDLNEDGAVDIVDLNMLLIDWGKTGGFSDARSDANGDGTVDIVDLNTVLIDWGK